MRHQRKGRKLGRDASHRKALYSNMAGALFEHGRIKTTEAKAKELRPIAEKLVTLARKDATDVQAQRQAVAFLRSRTPCTTCSIRWLRALSIVRVATPVSSSSAPVRAMPPRWCTWSSSTTSLDLRLTVAYDGTDFSGWAVQPGLRTVCGVLAEALEVDPSAVTVAGRTDKGVHAVANVAGGDAAADACRRRRSRLGCRLTWR